MQFNESILSSFAFLSAFIPNIFIVQSGSMEPSIKTGSAVITIKSDSYERNDVITFKNANKATVTHRIQYKFDEENNYLTAGDANKTLDQGKVSNQQIIGKVIFTLPYAGYVAGFAKTPKGFILLVIIPATIIIYEEFKYLKKELLKLTAKYKKRKDENGITARKNRFSMLIPVIGALMVVVSISSAFFLDHEKSLGNILGAAESYGEKTAPLYNSNEFTCEAGATNLSIPQEKFVILKKVNGNIDVTVKLVGATPSSTYDIWINQNPGGCPLASPTLVSAITTDTNGDGIGNASAPLVAGVAQFWVSVVGGGQVLRSTSVSF